MLVDETIRIAGADLFGVDPTSLKSLGGEDGAVYACRKGSLAHVIKFIPMQEDQVPVYEEKLDFIHFLSENGVPVAAPRAALSGRLFERVAGADQIYTVLLSPLADGRHPTARNLYDWNERLFRGWGQVLGQMHALSRQYPKWKQPGDGTDSPPTRVDDWRAEQSYFADWCKEPKIVQRWNELLPQLECLPIERSGYGMVHNDLHQWNFFYNPDAQQGSGITIIDFDVCGYHWFIQDMAIPLYHAILDGARGGPKERLAFARPFMRAFLQGYEQANHLDESWLLHLPLFLRYRDILLYIVFSNTWPEEKRAPWQVTMLARQRSRILRNEPVLAGL